MQRSARSLQFSLRFIAAKTNKIMLNSSLSHAIMLLINFMGSYQFQEDCFVLIINRSHMTVFSPSVFKPVHTIQSQHGH